MGRLSAVFVLLLATGVQAAPARGELFPDFEAFDVRGEQAPFDSLLGAGPTLVVAITHRKGEKQMRAWFEAATEALGEVNLVSIVSVELGGWLPTKAARSWARGKVPEEWRQRTLFDTDKRMSRLLELDGPPKEPWIFVLDSQGRVLASVRGILSEENSKEVFEAYDSER